MPHGIFSVFSRQMFVDKIVRTTFDMVNDDKSHNFLKKQRGDAFNGRLYAMDIE